MDNKRALLISIAAYFATFILSLIATFGIGARVSSMTNSQIFVGGIVAILIVIVFSAWYFRGKNVKASFQSGLGFGILLIITSLALDFIIVSIRATIKTEVTVQDLLTYYESPAFWATIAIVLLTTTTVGHLKSLK